MKLINKSLLLGIGLGVALTLVGLSVWGQRYRQQLYFATAPAVLRPFTQQPVPGVPQSSEKLPSPWLPNWSSGVHEHWEITAQDVRPVELGSFKGKAVFLDFWATYCGPCLAELPGIERLAQSLANDRIAFLLVTREKPERVHEFLSRSHVGLPLYLAQGRQPPDLPVEGVPTAYFLDRNGDAVYRHIGGANWDNAAVRSFLRNLAER